MADYHLGTAHGKIVVDYDDRGIKSAERSFDRLRSAAARINRAMESAANVARAGRRHFTALAASVGAVGGSAALAISKITGLESAIQSLGQTTASGVQGVRQLVDSVRELSTISGAFSAITRSAFGINEVLARFPRWARDIMALNGAILSLRASMGLVARVSSNLNRTLVAGVASHRRFAAALAAGATAFTAYNAGFQRWIRSSFLATPLTIKAANATKTFAGQLMPAANAMSNLVRGMSTMVIGAAFVVRGFQGISAAAKLAAKAVGGMSIVTAAFSVLGTATLGLIDAIKQLSGVVLLIPGAFTSLGIVLGVTMTAFMGFGDAMKAAAMEGEEFDKAIEKLSPTMQGVARSAKPFANEMRNLRDIAQQGVLGDFGQDIQVIGSTYIPVLRQGINQVAGSIRAVKNEFRSYLLDPNTVKDTAEAFSLTEEIMRNLSATVQPLGEAMRNLGIVGMEALRDLTGGAGSAAERLAEFMWQARQSGQLRGWIDSAIQGFRDLWSILKDVYNVSKTIFQAFGSDGENALARASDAMERFNDRVNESANNGSLKVIADHLKRMSRTSIDAIVEVFRQLVDVLKAAAPFLEQFSQAMVGAFISNLKAVGPILEGFFTVLSQFSQIGTIVGLLTGLGVAAKVFGLVLVPVTRSIALLVGGLAVLRGAGTAAAASMGIASAAIKAVGASAVVAGVQTGAFGTAVAAIGSRVPVIARMQESFYKGAIAAERFGRTAGVARAAMTGLSSAASGLLSTLGGPLVAAIAAVAGSIMAWKSQSDAVKAMNDQIKTSAQNAAQGTRELVDAFKEASGVVDAGVIQVLIENLETLRQDLDNTASKSTGFLQDFGAYLKDSLDPSLWGTFAGEQGKANDAIDAAAQKARNASTAIKDLGMSNEELAAKVRGSQSDWDGVVSRLQAMGEWGRDAIDSLQPMRDTFVEIQDAMSKVAPGGNQLSEAIGTIADKSATAADRLDAMKSALQSLGLMSLNAEEAFAQFHEEIDNLADSSNIAINAAAGLGDALLTSGGKLDLTNENARNLRQSLIDLGDGFLRSVEGGQDANEAFEQMQPALQGLANAYGLPIEKMQELVRTAGAVPEVVQTLVSLKGQDEAVQQLTALALKAQEIQLQVGQPITMQISDEQARATLTNLGFTVQELSDKAGVFKVTADTPEALTRLNEVLRIKDLLKTPPGVVPVTTSGVDQTNSQLDSVQDSKDEINRSTAIAQVEPGDGLWSTSAELIALTEHQDEINSTPVVVEADASQAEVAQGDIAGMADSVVDAGTKMAEFATSMANAMAEAVAAAGNMATQVVEAINLPAGMARLSGNSVGVNFAAGIRSSIADVRAAAMELAEAAAAPLPRSPAKIGPFSGRGWTLYRGRALASGFAQGIYSGSPEAQNATLDMAKAISDIIDNALTQLGMASTKFNANIDNKAGTRYYRDPNISDAQLAQQRAERAEEQAQRDKDQAYRDKKQAALDEQNRIGREKWESENATATRDNTQSIQELAEQYNLTITSNKRNEPGSFHNTGEAWDISGAPEDMMRLNRYLAETDPNARELFYDPGINIDEGRRIGAIGGHSDHLHYVPSLREYREDRQTQKTIAKNTTNLDAEQQQVASAIIAEGRRQNRSDEEIVAAIQAGLVESELRNLPYGSEDSVGPLQLRAMHGTVEQRMDPTFSARWFFEEMDRLGVGGQRAPDIAADVQRPAEQYRGRYATRDAEARAILASLDSIDGSSGTTSRYVEIEAKTAEQLVDELSSQDQELKQAVETLNNQSASDEEIIRALQTIDDKKLTVEDPDVRDQLESLQSATMEDRGIKKYDPFEGASTDLLGDSIRLAQTIVGFVDMIENGIKGAVDTLALLTRGISSTKDLDTLIDGFQSMASTVGQIISTVGEVISIVSSIAAAAGSAIPGVGAVLAPISAITGGIGNVNAIIDLVQDVMHIGGRIVGGFLSMLAGGANGPLYGNIRTLLDMNDRTIKTWSDRNPAEKTVTGLPGAQPRDPNQAPGINNLNIYQGPGQDPTDMMNKAMFVVKSHSQGVFAG